MLVTIYNNQDERAPDITPSSTYIPLSDDYPTPQDKHHVDHDGVYYTYHKVTKFSCAPNSQF